MQFTLERIINPTIEPVSRAEIKVHLRLPTTDTSFDDNLDILIASAREWVEAESAHALIDQKWRLSIGNFGSFEPSGGYATIEQIRSSCYCSGPVVWAYDRGMYLHRTPIIALTKFASVDSAGTETAVTAGTYEVRDALSKWPRIVGLTGASWTWGRQVIEYRAGYADRTGSPTEGAEKVPARFKAAMLLHIEAHFTRDEKMMERLIKGAGDVIARLDATVPMA